MILEIIARKRKRAQQLINIDPGCHGVVVRKVKLVLFARHRQAFKQPQRPIDTGESAASIFDPPCDDLKGQAGSTADMQPQQRRINIRA